MTIPVELILICLSPIFFIFIGWEWLHSVRQNRPRYQWQDSLANLCLAAMHQAGDAVSLLLLLPVFYWVSQHALWQIEFSWTALAALFLLQDFLYYWFHRASHRIRWLWASHVVHHSSRLMNFSTAFRQSLTYPISGMWLFWLPLVWVGFDVRLVLAVVAINLAFQFFVHTQHGRYWWWFGFVFNTPAVHRVHHACNAEYIDRNFAGVLVIWDRLFGTYQAEQAPCRFGITDDFSSNNPLTITFYEWRKMVWLWPRLPSAGQRLKLLFGAPECFAEQSAQFIAHLHAKQHPSTSSPSNQSFGDGQMPDKMSSSTLQQPLTEQSTESVAKNPTWLK